MSEDLVGTNKGLAVVDEKEYFSKHVTEIYNAITSKNENLQLQKLVITKNDSMKKRVEQILGDVGRKAILVASRSGGISKMISIVEITKQQLRLQDEDASIRQYNKIYRFDSLNHPHVKASKIDTPNAEENSYTHDQAVQEIRGPKTYKIQIMYTLLVPGSYSNLVLKDWTPQ